MRIKGNILRVASESIMINNSDHVESVELNISLPGHTIRELEELKSKIEKNGVEVPILVRSIPTGFEVIDGNYRLQICRKLGRACPAIVLNVDDVRAREIALEENLSRRPMTLDQKKELAYQLRKYWRYSNAKIAERLCVSHVTVGNWLGPARPDDELDSEQEICNFFMRKRKSISRIMESFEELMTDTDIMSEYERKELDRGIHCLEEDVHTLSELLTEVSKALNEPQHDSL
jgi:ParB/RepB/Spo0J family partition protein